MIIQCDKCHTKFRLDDSRITGNGVKVRCTKCQNVFIVTPPPVEDAHLEEILVPNQPAGEEKNTLQERPRPQARKENEANLKFDFDATPKNEACQESEKAPSEAPEKSGLTFNDIDFSFKVDHSKHEEWDLGFDQPGNEAEKSREGFQVTEPHTSLYGTVEDRPPEGPDFDFGEDETEAAPGAEEKPVPPVSEAPADSMPEKKAEAEPKPAASSGENVIPFSPGYTREGRPATATEKKSETFSPEPLRPQPKITEEFSDVLFNSMSKETAEKEEEEEVSKKVGPAPGRSAKLGLVVAFLIFIAGGSLIYFTGVIDSLAKRLIPAQQVPVKKKNIEIETINGLYAENKNFGRFFVLQARIKNTSEVPQDIKAVTGVLYNAAGQKIASRSVSPGRVLSQDDIKNLSKEDLLKPFKDASGGSIPPRGSVPVMVPFTEVPQGVSEYGLDIIR